MVHLTADLAESNERMEKALSEHAASARAAQESCCDLQTRAEEEKDRAVTEARSAAVEEFKAGPAFEKLLREKSEWALMEVAGAILGEFKGQGTLM